MKTLAIDIETYSSVNLKEGGVYAYVDSSDFEVLLFSYSYDGGEVKLIDLTKEDVPKEVINDLTDENVLKTAFNANFEITCLKKQFGLNLEPAQWDCTMVKGLMLGFPGALFSMGPALGLSKDVQKTNGNLLIKYFCMPCKPTKANGGRTRNLPEHNMEKWQEFCEYNKQDVVAELAIREKLAKYENAATAFERRLWKLDQEINDRGIEIDGVLLTKAIDIAVENAKALKEEAIKLTGLENPNSVQQLKGWIEARGHVLPSLNKENVEEFKKTLDDDLVSQVLKLRGEMRKASVKKYGAMRNALCSDGRVRGLMQYYGANRTGRWAGRLVQVQNLPRNYLEDLDTAREMVKKGSLEHIKFFYGDVNDTLSQLVRTAFVAKDGYTFAVSDFSAIEARVLAWLASEEWRLKVFKTHGKIYEASAARMFNVPLESIGKGSALRQKGKVAELALGYGGSVGALEAMGALNMGLSEDELKPLVDSWRAANTRIKNFWYKVENAAFAAIEGEGVQALDKGIKIALERGSLVITLPSKRKLYYVKPSISEGRYGYDVIKYKGLNQTTRKWEDTETYGAKLVENITQAVARDCLAEAMIRLDDNGYEIVMHVHDEVVVEVPKHSADIDVINNIMAEPIKWAKGLPLNADGYITKYYRKD